MTNDLEIRRDQPLLSTAAYRRKQNIYKCSDRKPYPFAEFVLTEEMQKAVEKNRPLMFDYLNTYGRIFTYYWCKSAEIDDLRQILLMCLARAVHDYQPEKGTKLSTYAYEWYRAGIGFAARHRNRLRPVQIIDRHWMEDIVYDHRTIPGEDGSDFSAALTAEEFLRHLRPRDADILMRYYGYGDTLEIIAHDYEISRERVRQILIKAMERVRKVAARKGCFEGDVTEQIDNTRRKRPNRRRPDGENNTTDPGTIGTSVRRNDRDAECEASDQVGSGDHPVSESGGRQSWGDGLPVGLDSGLRTGPDGDRYNRPDELEKAVPESQVVDYQI